MGHGERGAFLVDMSTQLGENIVYQMPQMLTYLRKLAYQ